MSKKAAHIQDLITPFEGKAHDARYLAFFGCFNRQLFFEAHEVLEDLWLLDRDGPNGNFYKGLIQFAGAFVHIQKARPGPARALLALAHNNLGAYGTRHESLDLAGVLRMIDSWTARVRETTGPLPLLLVCPPQLSLDDEVVDKVADKVIDP